MHLHQQERIVQGFAVWVDMEVGHLTVTHDGQITWDQLQAVKNEVWGRDARAIEVYPAAEDVVNAGNFRHLWRLGESDFCPDLLTFRATPLRSKDALETRCFAAWLEAGEAFA